MFNRLLAIYATGSTVYAIIRNSAAEVWNGSAFVAYNAANWSTYAVSLAEQGATGTYTAAIPGGITTKGVYAVAYHRQMGSSPAVSDPIVFEGTFGVGAYTQADVTEFGGTAGTFSAGRPEVNTTHWGGTAVGSANVRANLIQIDGQTASASGTVTFPAATLASTTNITAGTITNVTTVNGLANNVITANSISSNAITDDKIASGALTASKFASGAFDAVWTVGTRTLTSFGSLVADVWNHTTRILTAGTNIVLAKGTGITGFNDLSAAQVKAQADAALADVGLDYTIVGRIDQPISSRLAAAAYTAPLDAAGTRAALGLATANLDTQLSGIQTGVNAINVTDLNNLSSRYLTLIELDGPDWRYTTKALEQAPTGSGGFTSSDRTDLQTIRKVVQAGGDTLSL